MQDPLGRTRTTPPQPHLNGGQPGRLGSVGCVFCRSWPGLRRRHPVRRRDDGRLPRHQPDDAGAPAGRAGGCTRRASPSSTPRPARSCGGSPSGWPRRCGGRRSAPTGSRFSSPRAAAARRSARPPARDPALGGRRREDRLPAGSPSARTWTSTPPSCRPRCAPSPRAPERIPARRRPGRLRPSSAGQPCPSPPCSGGRSRAPSSGRSLSRSQLESCWSSCRSSRRNRRALLRRPTVRRDSLPLSAGSRTGRRPSPLVGRRCPAPRPGGNRHLLAAPALGGGADGGPDLGGGRKFRPAGGCRGGAARCVQDRQGGGPGDAGLDDHDAGHHRRGRHRGDRPTAHVHRAQPHLLVRSPMDE